MGDTTWSQIFEIARPHVVRISTPSGSGTGFLVSRSADGNLLAIATAAHVIDHAHYWEQPIRVEHFASGKSLLLRHRMRAIFLAEEMDTAAVMFKPGELPFPAAPLKLAPEDKHLKVGLEIGWVGFPALSNSGLCFFSGRVSAFRSSEHAYLVDGVAINGVSGGPALFNGLGEAVVMGVVSAYIPNRATGVALPGLSVIRDVSHFQSLAKALKSLDEAKAKESPPTQPPPGTSDAPPLNLPVEAAPPGATR
jgi:S1-C subfamily serine protease